MAVDPPVVFLLKGLKLGWSNHPPASIALSAVTIPCANWNSEGKDPSAKASEAQESLTESNGRSKHSCSELQLRCWDHHFFVKVLDLLKHLSGMASKKEKKRFCAKMAWMRAWSFFLMMTSCLRTLVPTNSPTNPSNQRHSTNLFACVLGNQPSLRLLHPTHLLQRNSSCACAGHQSKAEAGWGATPQLPPKAGDEMRNASKNLRSYSLAV